MFGLYSGGEAQREMQVAMGRIRRLGGSRRFWELDRLERYYGGTQHDGKPSWWNDDVPAREREPCILSGLPKAAVEQAVRFTLGEGKFPQLRFSGSDEEKRTIGGINLGLTKEEGQKLDKLWKDVGSQIKIKLTFREALRRGLSMRTACGVFSLRDGVVAIDLLNAKNCEIEWEDNHKSRPARLECRYIFPREEQQKDGTVKEVWYWYRRVVDAEWDKVYKEVRVENGDEPTWTVDRDKSTQHNTGFAPVFWFPNLPRMDVGDSDGVAIIDGCEDEIDAIDYALSARHTGAFVYGSPQGYQIGVVDSKGPAADGRVAGSVDYFDAIGPDGKPAGVVGYKSQNQPARKRSAFSVWTFEDKKTEVDVGLMEASGTAAKMVTEHVTDLRARLLESIQVVLVDPASVAGRSDMSAKLLELLYAPLLALVDDLRECWGDHLKTLCGGLFRFLLVHYQRGAVVFIPSLDEAAPILKRFLVPAEDGTEVWVPPECELNWGDYFAPTNADIREAVELAKSARGAKTGGGAKGLDTAGDPLIARKRAVSFVAPYFGIDDVDAELEDLEKETAEKEAKEQENAQRELDAALTQIGAKTGAQGAQPNAKPGAPSKGNPGGRPQGGKNNPGAKPGKPAGPPKGK